MIPKEVLKQFHSIVGAENVLDSELNRFSYSYDSSFVPLLPANKPDVVVRPATTDQVSSIMALANTYAIPVTPRGTASGRTGGCIPVAGGISMSLERMKKILELDDRNMTIYTALQSMKCSSVDSYRLPQR